MQMKGLFVIGLFLVASRCFGVSADSLENELKTAQGERKVKVMNELFRAYINSDPVKAIGYAREALTLATEINDTKGTGAAYNNLGIAYKNQGALDIALEYYIKSLDRYTSIQNGEGIATSKNNIANIYSMKKDYSQALKYFEDSHAGFVALGDPEKIIGSMNNLGNLHSDLDLYDQARTYFNEAWALSVKSGKQFSDPLSNLGNLSYKEGKYQQAVEYYLRALDIVRKQGDRLSELSLLTNLGQVYTRAGQPKPAQQYLDQAFALAAELNASIYTPQLLRTQAANFAKQGKMKEAYEMMLKYDDAREKVYGEESTRKIAQMDVALDLADKERQIEALQIDDEMKTLRLRNTQAIITSVVLAIVTVLAVFNLFLLGKRLRKA
jgi:tetratricopeptide (TPR) repeat protein